MKTFLTQEMIKRIARKRRKSGKRSLLGPTPHFDLPGQATHRQKFWLIRALYWGKEGDGKELPILTALVCTMHNYACYFVYCFVYSILPIFSYFLGSLIRRPSWARKESAVNYFNMCLESDHHQYPAVTISEMMSIKARITDIRDWLDNLISVAKDLNRQMDTSKVIDVLVCDMSWAVTYLRLSMLT